MRIVLGVPVAWGTGTDHAALMPVAPIFTPA
jgi:hypothetical protein